MVPLMLKRGVLVGASSVKTLNVPPELATYSMLVVSLIAEETAPSGVEMVRSSVFVLPSKTATLLLPGLTTKIVLVVVLIAIGRGTGIPGGRIDGTGMS